MLRRLIIPACASLALLSGTAWAQSSSSNNDSQKNDPGAATLDDETIQHGPQKLREKLTADGYTEVKIAPGSYVVSAKDKDGNRVMMMIGPTSMTMMKMPDQSPSQAQVPDSSKDEIIQQ